MRTVSIHDAKTNLSKYILATKKGEKIYIGSFGKPEVVLEKVTNPKNAGVRNLAALKNKVSEVKDSFSNETDAVIADMLYGE